MAVKVTRHFREETLPRRPYLAELMHRVAEALEHPIRVEAQPDGRTRRWVYCPEGRRYLRVVVDVDGETVHTAFYDRGYRPDRE